MRNHAFLVLVFLMVEISQLVFYIEYLGLSGILAYPESVRFALVRIIEVLLY